MNEGSEGILLLGVSLDKTTALYQVCKDPRQFSRAKKHAAHTHSAEMFEFWERVCNFKWACRNRPVFRFQISAQICNTFIKNNKGFSFNDSLNISSSSSPSLMSSPSPSTTSSGNIGLNISSKCKKKILETYGLARETVFDEALIELLPFMNEVAVEFVKLEEEFMEEREIARLIGLETNQDTLALDEVLSSETKRSVFERVLIENFAEENLYFYMALLKFSSMEPEDPQLYATAKQIYLEFIQNEECEDVVNISSDVKKRLKASIISEEAGSSLNTEDPPMSIQPSLTPDLFDEAKIEVYKMLSDSFGQNYDKIYRGVTRDIKIVISSKIYQIIEYYFMSNEDYSKFDTVVRVSDKISILAVLKTRRLFSGFKKLCKENGKDYYFKFFERIAVYRIILQRLFSEQKKRKDLASVLIKYAKHIHETYLKLSASPRIKIKDDTLNRFENILQKLGEETIYEVYDTLFDFIVAEWLLDIYQSMFPQFKQSDYFRSNLPAENVVLVHKNLRSLLQDKVGRKMFINFLKDEKKMNETEFLQKYFDYTDNPTSQIAHQIYKSHIKANSPLQIEISGNIRLKLKKVYKKSSPKDLFDEAFENLLNLLEPYFDSFINIF